MIYLKLFLSFLQVGVFSIGGGYAAIPIIQSQVVDSNHWLSMGEFTNLVTIAEMTPGPVSINSATFVGIRIAGIPGAIVATLGCILPACIIVSVLAMVYRKFSGTAAISDVLSTLRPVVIALITAAGLSMLQTALFGNRSVRIQNIEWISVILFGSSFFMLRKRKRKPNLYMLETALLGIRSVRFQNFEWISVILFVAAFFMLSIRKWISILVMCLCGVASLIIYCISLI